MKEDIKYKFKFEQRAYNENATPEEIQAIKDGVFAYDENVIYVKEIPIVSPFSINICFDEMERLGKEMIKHGILIDIRDTQKPDSKTRRVINGRFSKICESVEHVSFCTGKNVIINTAARFVLYQTNLDSYSIHKTAEAAFKAIKEKVNE